MPYKQLQFLLLHRLLLGRWRSPYHRLAYELHRPRSSTLHHLLDCGLRERAWHLLKTTELATPALLARAAYFSGEPETALTQLLDALTAACTTPAEKKQSIKLLTRISPRDAAEWASRTGKKRLAVQINAALQPEYAPSFFSGLERRKEEHLLIANSLSSPKEKLLHLNRYFSEMKLQPIHLVENAGKFDINCLTGSPFPAFPKNKSNIGNKKVSVIMTVYNGERYIESAATSVLEQAGICVELIIIDDGSTDSTWSVISRLQAANPETVHALKLQRNAGTYRAKNIALGMCRGKYIAFQDADDWSHPQRLAKAVAWLEKSSRRVAVTCRYVRLNTNSMFYSPATWPIQQWSPNTLVFKRSAVLKRVGGFDEVKAGGDTEYFERIRAVFGDARIAFQVEIMLIAMSLPSSLMHDKKTGVTKTGYSAARAQYREECAEKLLNSVWNKTSLKLPIRIGKASSTQFKTIL
ncbi:glycosyltransferase family 2 protein [Achromobacter pestifer]